MAVNINASTSSGIGITSDNSGVIQFQSNASNTAIIDASGNVGIGTNSPSSRLHVADSSGGGNGRIRMSCVVSAGYDSRIFQDDTGLNFSAVSDTRSLVFRTGNSDTERMRIDGSGNLLFNSGYGSVATAYGCRAWVNFNGTGTVAIRASGNVTSITDNGTGTYTVNITIALPDANYAVTVAADNGASTTLWACTSSSGATPTTSAVRVQSFNTVVTLTDANYMQVAIFR